MGMCRNLAMCQLNSLAAHAAWEAGQCQCLAGELGSVRAYELRMQMSSLPPQQLSGSHLFWWFQVTQPLDRPAARLGLPSLPLCHSGPAPAWSLPLMARLWDEREFSSSCPSQNSLLFWEAIADSSTWIEHNLHVKLLELWVQPLLFVASLCRNILYQKSLLYSPHLRFHGDRGDSAGASCLEIVWIRYDPKINVGTGVYSLEHLSLCYKSFEGKDPAYKSLPPSVLWSRT